MKAAKQKPALKIKVALTGQHFAFPSESFLTQSMDRTVRTPIGIKTRTKYSGENSSPNQTQAHESRFRKHSD